MVKEYSVKKDGNTRIEPNFKVKEFACKDGTDLVLIDTEVVRHLQQIRDCTGATSVHISSGYRTAEYNKKIGGSATSKHVKGLAVDFVCKKLLTQLPSKKIACIAEILGLVGIEIIDNYYLHIDTRKTQKWFSIQYIENGKRKYTTLQEMGYNSWFAFTRNSLEDLGIVNPFAVPLVTVKKGDKGDNVRWVQYQLVLAKCLPLLSADGKCNIDGNFGAGTESALKLFQNKHGLEVDGKCGGQTRKALLTFV